MYITNEKYRYSECFKKVLEAGPRLGRNILSSLSPNPARPDLQLWFALHFVGKAMSQTVHFKLAGNAWHWYAVLEVLPFFKVRTCRLDTRGRPWRLPR